MFLWMVEEFTFILCHLPKDDWDGALVLGHELLLLAHSHCRRKRGSCRVGATPLDRLPFRRIYVGLRPSMRHCTMGAHMRNICHPEGVTILLQNLRVRNAGARHYSAGVAGMGSV